MYHFAVWLTYAKVIGERELQCTCILSTPSTARNENLLDSMHTHTYMLTHYSCLGEAHSEYETLHG